MTTTRIATELDRSAMARLWLMFRHDMSEFTGALPDADGRFREERLQAAFGDPGWLAYVIEDGEAKIGFAIVRGLDQPVRVISSFFIAKGARRNGAGLAAAARIARELSGRWEVAFQEANAPAVGFWSRVAAAVSEDWQTERRLVPGRPDLPPDTWISFVSEKRRG